MEKAGVEKFIQLVKECPELYDKNHQLFRNFALKDKIWERIAKELGETDVVALRTKWKGLKDGYTKYKKWSRTCHPAVKSYCNWCWGPYMEFMAPHIAPRKKCDRDLSSSTIIGTKDDMYHLDLSSSDQTVEEKPTIGDNGVLEEEMIEYVESEPPSPNSSQYKPVLQDPMAVEEPSCINTNLLNFVHTKQSKGVDAIDLLFMSYADTFRKFTLPTQTELKIKMATMFAEAELAEHNLQ